MAHDERLALRVRRVLAGRRDIEEKSMFGGLAFMARDDMCCGVVQSTVMVRVDPRAYDRLLLEPGVRRWISPAGRCADSCTSIGSV